MTTTTPVTLDPASLPAATGIPTGSAPAPQRGGAGRTARSLVAPARQLAALGRVATAAAGARNASDVFDLAAREAAALVRAHDATIIRFGSDGSASVCGQAWRGASTASPGEPPADLLRRCALPDGGPLWLAGAQAGALFPWPCVDALVVPIRLGRHLYGAIAAGRSEGEGWGEDAARSLQAVSAVLAGTLATTALAREAALEVGDAPRRQGAALRRRQPPVARPDADLLAELVRAIEREELFLRYQPIVSLRTNQLAAFEALLRWRHPRRGIVGPSEFVGAAEDSGLIRAMTAGVVRAVCRDAAHLNAVRSDEQPVATSINLCGAQLDDPRLLQLIVRTLAEFELPAERLWIEVTENTIVGDRSDRLDRLHELHALGAKLALDDFGSGYASLGCVRRLPLDLIKLDRSLVRGAAVNPCDATILAAAIAMAHALGIDVVAEGIETAPQLVSLQALSCGLVQGHYFSRAVDAQQAVSMIAQPLPWLEGNAAIRERTSLPGATPTTTT